MHILIEHDSQGDAVEAALRIQLAMATIGWRVDSLEGNRTGNEMSYFTKYVKDQPAEVTVRAKSDLDRIIAELEAAHQSAASGQNSKEGLITPSDEQSG